MKNLVKVFLVCLVTFSAIAGGDKDKNLVTTKVKTGVFKFESETVDYGTIKQNANGKRVFTFKNTGNAPILISNVKASCGCTVPTKPSKAILPGETGEIGVNYDTKRIGSFSKSITITSNAAESSKIIKIKGVVLKAENAVSLK